MRGRKGARKCTQGGLQPGRITPEVLTINAKILGHRNLRRVSLTSHQSVEGQGNPLGN